MESGSGFELHYKLVYGKEWQPKLTRHCFVLYPSNTAKTLISINALTYLFFLVKITIKILQSVLFFLFFYEIWFIMRVNAEVNVCFHLLILPWERKKKGRKKERKNEQRKISAIMLWSNTSQLTLTQPKLSQVTTPWPTQPKWLKSEWR